ncbi:MAG TPA: protein kinase [Candidatus Obscuribacterales bacterium]
MLEELERQSEVCCTCQKRFPAGTERCPEDGSKLFAEQVCRLVGTTFAERYEILEPVGEGGMSVVYRARHIHMQRIVAIKLLHERIASDEKALLRFKREAQATGNLSHQNVISVYDFGVTKDHQAFFVMDFLEGEALDAVIKKEKRIEPARAVSIFKQICDGLEHAHKKGVIHRDLKPSNIILVPQDDGFELVKIVDFGIAKMVSIDASSKQQLTQTGQVFGSPLYLSPEQCQGIAIDNRSDIYSLGCLMYEALAGKPPLIGDTAIATMLKHINDPPPLFSAKFPEAQIPQPIEYVVRKCLEKSPESRYQTVAELRQSLLDAAAASNLEGYRTGGVIDVPKKQEELASTWDKLVASMPGLSPARKSGRRWLMAAAIALPTLLVVGVLLFAFLWPGPADDRGTPVDKFRWLWLMSEADKSLARNDYAAALNTLDRAEQVATTFGDSANRLLRTLKLKSQVLGLANMFEQQESVNNQIMTIQVQQIQKETDEVRALLKRLLASGDSPVAVEKARLEAEANSERVLLSARRLDSRGMLDEEESFLKQAISTYEWLNLRQSPTLASLKMQLATCLTGKQELPEVRPLLLSALTIRRSLPNQESRAVKRLVLQSMLKLGQFDRDQSNFKDARTELLSVLEQVRREFPQDRELMRESLQSYADLLRQTGEIEEFQKVQQEARRFGS